MIARHVRHRTDRPDEPSESSWVTGFVAFEQNECGAMTIIDPDTNATYHLVEYSSPTLRNRASQLPRDATVEVRLSRAGFRANVWRAEAIYRVTPSLTDSRTGR